MSSSVPTPTDTATDQKRLALSHKILTVLGRRSTWFGVSIGANVVLFVALLGVTLNLIPLHPVIAELRGGAIMTAPDAKSWHTAVELFNTLGNGPMYTTHNPDVTRAFMRNGEIINLPTPELHAKLGNDIIASRYFVVSDPRMEAERVVKFLQDRGYQARFVIDAEKKLNPGAMAFVTSNAFPGWSIVLRKHGPQMGEPLEAWSWPEFNQQKL
jgi:hypothetical protein